MGNASDQPLGLGNTLLPSVVPMVAAFTEHTGDPNEYADAGTPITIAKATVAQVANVRIGDRPTTDVKASSLMRIVSPLGARCCVRSCETRSVPTPSRSVKFPIRVAAV